MPQYTLELSERTINRIRDYVARESLDGRQTSVSEVIEKVVNHALDELETYNALKQGRQPG